MSDISKFDTTNAIIRLLLTLLEHEGINHTLLQQFMAKIDAKRGTLDTSIKVALELDLINIKVERVGSSPRASNLHYLTEKGHIIAQKLSEIQEILESS